MELAVAAVAFRVGDAPGTFSEFSLTAVVLTVKAAGILIECAAFRAFYQPVTVGALWLTAFTLTVGALVAFTVKGVLRIAAAVGVLEAGRAVLTTRCFVGGEGVKGTVEGADSLWV